jgi:hypothetical protein
MTDLEGVNCEIQLVGDNIDDSEVQTVPEMVEKQPEKSSAMNKLLAKFEVWADKKFSLKKRGTTVGTELRAASATFLTLSYILLLNPQVMTEIEGLDANTVVIGTAFSSGIGCLLAGYFG